MDDSAATWGIVLAGGSGTRLSGLTTDASGTVVPKQFCSLAGGPSLLRSTLRRMGAVVDDGRILVVVSADHRRWWEAELAHLPRRDVIVQPCNRGTACGLLLPLLTILRQDPEARIVVTPSDHHVADEEALQWSLMEALAHVTTRPRLLVLLGIEPDRPDTGYGWITAEPPGEDPIQEVVSFVEKPDEARARELLASGALWSSLIFATTAETLLAQFRHSLPRLVERFTVSTSLPGVEDNPSRLSSLYESLPSIDFSRAVLQPTCQHLHVLAVPPCGWTDLGTPQRVAECIRTGVCPFPEAACDGPSSDPLPAARPEPRPPLDLARAVAVHLGAAVAHLPDVASSPPTAVAHAPRR